MNSFDMVFSTKSYARWRITNICMYICNTLLHTLLKCHYADISIFHMLFNNTVCDSAYNEYTMSQSDYLT